MSLQCGVNSGDVITVNGLFPGIYGLRKFSWLITQYPIYLTKPIQSSTDYVPIPDKVTCTGSSDSEPLFALCQLISGNHDGFQAPRHPVKCPKESSNFIFRCRPHSVFQVSTTDHLSPSRSFLHRTGD